MLRHSDAGASRYLELLKPCLKAALQQQSSALRRVFNSRSGFDAAFSGVTEIFLDVTEVPIERADNHDVQEAHHGGKKIHTVKWLLICDAQKRLLFASAAYRGQVHDFTIFKRVLAGFHFSGLQIHVDRGF